MASAAKTLRVSFVQCRGTPYEVGRAQADAFAATRKGKAFFRKRVRLNEHGLAIGLHLVKARPRAPGLVSVLLVRRVLDSCATTAEAIDLLRRTPHAMQYNYSILDAGGVAAVVEAGAGAVAVRGGDWLACTNHFQSPQLRRLNRRVAHSIGRLPKLGRARTQCRTDIPGAELLRFAGLPQLR